MIPWWMALLSLVLGILFTVLYFIFFPVKVITRDRYLTSLDQTHAMKAVREAKRVDDASDQDG